MLACSFCLFAHDIVSLSVILRCFVNLTSSVSSLAHDAVVLFVFAYLVDVVVFFFLNDRCVFPPAAQPKYNQVRQGVVCFSFLVDCYSEWSVLVV